MATYKIPTFKLEIVNPTITIDENSVSDRVLDKLLSIDVTFDTPNSVLKGYRLTEIPYTGNWYDEDLFDLVMERLKDFEI